MDAVGSQYERLLGDFLSMGGDINSCPFDAEGHRYLGPSLKDGEIVASTELGCDSDWDPVVEEVWDEIKKNGLKGEPMTDEEWAKWEKESQETDKR